MTPRNVRDGLGYHSEKALLNFASQSYTELLYTLPVERILWRFRRFAEYISVQLYLDLLMITRIASAILRSLPWIAGSVVIAPGEP